MSGPLAELELQVLDALEFPGLAGDILFLRPAMKSAGSEVVEWVMASLSAPRLVAQVDGKKLWSLTEDCVRWLIGRFGVIASMPLPTATSTLGLR